MPTQALTYRLIEATDIEHEDDELECVEHPMFYIQLGFDGIEPQIEVLEALSRHAAHDVLGDLPAKGAVECGEISSGHRTPPISCRRSSQRTQGRSSEMISMRSWCFGSRAPGGMPAQSRKSCTVLRSPRAADSCSSVAIRSTTAISRACSMGISKRRQGCDWRHRTKRNTAMQALACFLLL